MSWLPPWMPPHNLTYTPLTLISPHCHPCMVWGNCPQMLWWQLDMQDLLSSQPLPKTQDCISVKTSPLLSFVHWLMFSCIYFWGNWIARPLPSPPGAVQWCAEWQGFCNLSDPLPCANDFPRHREHPPSQPWPGMCERMCVCKKQEGE